MAAPALRRGATSGTTAPASPPSSTATSSSDSAITTSHRIPTPTSAYYPRSHDVTLYVLRNSAHCHNFASTRTQLWDRIGLWAGEQAKNLEA